MPRPLIYPIIKDHIWIKIIPEWHNNGPVGMKVKVVKVDKHQVWYKCISGGPVRFLNEFSFRRIFALSSGFKLWAPYPQPTVPFLPYDYAVLKLGPHK